VPPADFGRYFPTKDAVILAIVDDLVQATAAALRHVDVAAGPEQALLIATTAVMTAITDGRGVITRERMLAMSEIISAQPNLRKQASKARKRMLTQAVAERMGVAAENHRVRQAVTVWSAIATGAYVSRSTMADHYDPSLDDLLEERMVVELTASFTEVWVTISGSPTLRHNLRIVSGGVKLNHDRQSGSSGCRRGGSRTARGSHRSGRRP
jgi:AcrR family transcriptional regulator